MFAHGFPGHPGIWGWPENSALPHFLKRVYSAVDSEVVFKFFGQFFDILRRPVLDIHPKMQTHA